MNNSKESEQIYQIYQEGIFDRVGARIKGVGNTKFFGGTGYNAGKAESFKGKFYDRIIKDIDKFLKEVQTMGNLRSLAEFEQKYPEIANKIACMADAVGHTTGLSTQCNNRKQSNELTKYTKPGESSTGPVIGKKVGYICVKNNCKAIPCVERNGKLVPFLKTAFSGEVFRTKEECEKYCSSKWDVLDPIKPDRLKLPEPDPTVLDAEEIRPGLPAPRRGLPAPRRGLPAPRKGLPAPR